jgi:hypothetical protein
MIAVQNVWFATPASVTGCEPLSVLNVLVTIGHMGFNLDDRFVRNVPPDALRIKPGKTKFCLQIAASVSKWRSEKRLVATAMAWTQ